MTSYSGLASRALARVDLPEPFGPHEGVDLAGLDRQVDATEDLGDRGGLPVGRCGDRAGVQVLDPEQLAHGLQSITPMRVVEMSLA